MSSYLPQILVVDFIRCENKSRWYFVFIFHIYCLSSMLRCFYLIVVHFESTIMFAIERSWLVWSWYRVHFCRALDGDSGDILTYFPLLQAQQIKSFQVNKSRLKNSIESSNNVIFVLFLFCFVFGKRTDFCNMYIIMSL